MRTFVIIIALILQAIFTQPALSSEPKRSKEEVIFNSNIEQINAEIEAVLSGMREFRKNKDTKQEDGTITTTATRSSEHSRESLFYEVDKLINYTLTRNPNLIFAHIAQLIHIAITQHQQTPTTNPTYRTSAYSSEQHHHPSTYALGQSLTTNDIISLLISTHDIINSIYAERRNADKMRAESLIKVSRYAGTATAFILGIITNSTEAIIAGTALSFTLPPFYKDHINSSEHQIERRNELYEQFMNQLQAKLDDRAAPYMFAFLSRKYDRLQGVRCEDPLLSILVNSEQQTQQPHQVRVDISAPATQAQETELEAYSTTQTRTHEL